MSIWSSVPGEIRAQDGDYDDANYHAQGDKSLIIGAATARSWHDHIRLSIDGPNTDVSAILSPAAVRELIGCLTAALDAECPFTTGSASTPRR
jgi:hypothetical protein